MAIDTERIFLLATKKSQRVENLTYCIGVHRLGTPNMEYILGETDNDREYRQGDEVSYNLSCGICLYVAGGSRLAK